jgi:hypothetical protein
MIRSTLPLIAAAFVLALPAAAGTLETYEYSNFDTVDASAGITVEFTQSADYTVVADFQRGERKDIRVSQRNGVLSVSRRPSRFWNRNTARVVVRITAPAVDSIQTSSGSSVAASGITAKDFELRVSSGGSAKIEGTCDQLSISASSGGSASAKSLICASVDAGASSGGSVSAHASERASSDTSSGGSVSIYGNPAERDANTSRSGGSTSFK